MKAFINFKRRDAILLISSIFIMPALKAEDKLKIGITLHPYYSWLKNIVKDKAEIIPLIDAGFNPHAYEVKAQDIKRVSQMDIVVLNAIGHDEFAYKMIKASDKSDLKIINANENVPILKSISIASKSGQAINPHTFISIGAAMLQINTIADKLGKISPQNADFFKENARKYNRRLRQLRSNALLEISDINNINVKIATVHGAYDYLLREFGLEVSAVIEPSHGISPGAAQLKNIIDKLKQDNIKILFSEKENPTGFVKTIIEETGIKAYPLLHITHGEYSDDKFEKDIKHNLDTIILAIKENAK